MDKKLLDEILDELLPTFEAMEAQSAALLMFLKDKEVATDYQLAPYMRQAADASNVRWRATRVRMERLLSAAMKEEPVKQENTEAVKPEPEGDQKPKQKVEQGPKQKVDEKPSQPVAPTSGQPVAGPEGRGKEHQAGQAATPKDSDNKPARSESEGKSAA